MGGIVLYTHLKNSTSNVLFNEYNYYIQLTMDTNWTHLYFMAIYFYEYILKIN